MKRLYILPILLTLSQAGCIEEYNPNLSTRLSAIVVEGLVTNLSESYTVKISEAVPFDSAANATGIMGAEVTIADDLGNTYLMHEDDFHGNYYSNSSEFVAVPGRSYTLQIKMPNGDLYESSAQRLTVPAIIDSVYGDIANKEYLYTDQLGNLTTKMASGSETFMDISNNADSIIQFRFDNTLMKCFTYWYAYTPEMKAAEVPFPPANPCFAVACPYVMYNWQKFELNTAINLTNRLQAVNSNTLKNNSVCFFPFDDSFYPLTYRKDTCGHDPGGHLQCITLRTIESVDDILQTRIYSLTEESSVYYNEISNQLSSEGKLFDPVAVQLQGNIKCMNNPNKLALGFFEVSSCTTKSYRLVYDYIAGTTTYQPVADITGLAGSGSSQYIPEFWQLIFQ